MTKKRLATKPPRAPRSRAVISYTMSRIRAQDTSIELALRFALWKEGLRYRKNYKSLTGRPDIVFVRQRIAIFCDSSFWHGRHVMKSLGKITSNKDYWTQKLLGNMRRDKKINRELRKAGWRVLRFWDEDIEK